MFPNESTARAPPPGQSQIATRLHRRFHASSHRVHQEAKQGNESQLWNRPGGRHSVMTDGLPSSLPPEMSAHKKDFSAYPDLSRRPFGSNARCRQENHVRPATREQQDREELNPLIGEVDTRRSRSPFDTAGIATAGGQVRSCGDLIVSDICLIHARLFVSRDPARGTGDGLPRTSVFGQCERGRGDH